MTDYRDGKLHGWTGGECPVHQDDRVWVVFRGGEPGEDLGGYFNWAHRPQSSSADIIAFRVAEKAKEPMMVWVNIWPGVGLWAYREKECAESSGLDFPERSRIAVPFREVRE